MARPGANIILSNGNLNPIAPGAFGTPVLVVATPIAPVAGYLTAFSVKSKLQVSTAFAQVGNERVIDAINQGFFAEAPEGTELFIVACVNTNTLTQMAVEGIAGKGLDLANGTGRLVAFVKFYPGAYSITVGGGFDADVHTAVTAAQVLADAWLAKRKPWRALIQGYGFVDATAAQSYAASTKRNIAIVVGSVHDGTADSTQLATLLALGRASKEEPQRNIGRVKSGSLAIAEAAVVKIGSATVEAMASVDLDTLHTKRYITFERNEIESGYIFNDDNLLTALTDDYASLANGRVIDNAVRVAYQAYYEELKDDVEVDENGRLATVVEKALENKIESAIDGAMRNQLSKEKDGRAAVFCRVNPDPVTYASLYAQNEISSPNFNIFVENKVYVFVSMRPKFCNRYIDVYIGFTATT